MIEGDLDAALLPFRAAVAAGVQAVMTGHLLVPDLDDAPASLSGPILSGLLRGELGFDGLIVTDALEMAARQPTYGVEEAAVRALVAGADSLGLGHDLHEEAVERVHAAIVDAVRTGRLAEERLAEAADRVAAALPLGVADGRRRRRPRVPAPKLRAARSRSPATSRSPARSSSSSSCPEANIAAGEALHGLADVLPDAVGDPAPRGSARSRRAARASTRAAGSSSSPATPRRHAWQQETVAAAAALRPDAIVVETGIPGRRPDAGASIVTYGAGRANLAAAAEALA